MTMKNREPAVMERESPEGSERQGGPADRLFLVHYCHPRCKPFQNIMRLPKEQAFSLAEKLARENPGATSFGRFADFANYYPRRLAADEFLYQNFLRLGGKPRERHPLSFVLQGCGYLEEWFGNGRAYKVRLSKISQNSVSFTLGDSCAQYERTGTIRQLTEAQLLAQISGFSGGVEDFLRDVSERYRCSYVEAQLWDDTAIQSGEIVDANT